MSAWLVPRRTIWPTRDGWWCLLAAFGLGLAAVNSGNNLLYLLLSMLLGLVIVSGILSEQSMRKLGLSPVVPDEIYAGRPTVFGARIANRKRWLASHSLTLEVRGRAGVERELYLERIEAGGERLVTWQATLPARGRRRLPGVRVTTRFPFGLFVKAGRLQLTPEVIVYPAVRPIAPDERRALGGHGASAARRRGRGHDLYNLREYRATDDPRLIHWRSSAKAQALLVRELEDETSVATRIELEGTGASDPARLERGLAEAASLVVHLLRAGGAVELAGPGLLVPLAPGATQARRILTALALYEPDAAASPPGPASRPARRARVIRVTLG